GRYPHRSVPGCIHHTLAAACIDHTDAKMKRLRAFLTSWEALLVVLLILAIIMGTSLSPYFFTGFNASSLTRDLMEKAIMALPMTLIIIAGEIDLSVASVLGMASVVLGVTWNYGVPIWVGMIMVL